MKVLVAQLGLTFCDPMDCSPPASSVHGILQARTLEWVDNPFSGNLPEPRDGTGSPALQADSLPSESPAKPMKDGNPSKDLSNMGMSNPYQELFIINIKGTYSFLQERHGNKSFAKRNIS